MGRRGTFATSHTRPSWSKRLSDLKLGEPKRRRKTSLNAKYDKYRLPSPPPRDEQSEEGGKAGRARRGRDAPWQRWDSRRHGIGLSTGRRKWTDDLLEGRLARNYPPVAGTRAAHLHPFVFSPYGEEGGPTQDPDSMGDWTRKGEARVMTSRERPPLVRGRLGTFQADQPGSPLAVTDPVQLNILTDEETNQLLPSYRSQPHRRGQHLPLRGPTPFPHSRQSSDPPTRPVFPPLEAVSFASRCRSPPLLPNFNFHPDRTSTPRLDKLDGARVCAYSYTDSPSPLYPPTLSSDHLSPPILLQPWPRGGILKYSADHAGPRIPDARAQPRHVLGIANRLLDPSVFASGDPSMGQIFGVRFDDRPVQHAFSAFVSVSPLSEENGHNSPHRHRSPAHPPDPAPTVLYRDLESRAGKALPSVTEPSRESRADQFSRQPWLGNGSMFDQTPREAALASNAQGREESFRAQEVLTATQPPDNHHERVDVESDELNLHSLDGSKDDWLSHRNYPLQVYLFGDEPSHRSRSSIPSYSDPMTDAECGSVYSPSIVTESEDEWQPPKRVMRVSDAAWSFNIPRDVVERSRENGRRGHVKVDSKALHRKTREQGSRQRRFIQGSSIST